MTDVIARPDAVAFDSSSLGMLAVYNLGKRYGARTVVHDVSLNVRQGEAVGLLGPNGGRENHGVLYDHRPGEAR